MTGRIRTGYLLAALAVAAAFLAAVLLTARQDKGRMADEQLEAARIMAETEEYLKQMIQQKGILLQPEDLNATFLIGPEVTELTTTTGVLEAKRTSLVPDMAAMMVRFYDEAGLEKGDTVAIGSSGSFPGLAIASIAAAQVMGLKIKVIASLGASMYGATRVEFNIFDILLSMRGGGFADFELTAVSQGSTNDLGGGAWDGFLYEGTKEIFRRICTETAADTEAVFIDGPDLAASIKARLELFGDIDLFVNVGGAGACNGTTTRILDVPAGLVTSFDGIPEDETRGLVFEYLAEGIPVVNLLNVRQLAQNNGIPYDPVPMPQPGESDVYKETRYSIWLIIAGLVSIAAILVIGRRKLL